MYFKTALIYVKLKQPLVEMEPQENRFRQFIIYIMIAMDDDDNIHFNFNCKWMADDDNINCYYNYNGWQ